MSRNFGLLKGIHIIHEVLEREIEIPCICLAARLEASGIPRAFIEISGKSREVGGG